MKSEQRVAAAMVAALRDQPRESRAALLIGFAISELRLRGRSWDEIREAMLLSVQAVESAEAGGVT